MIEINDMIPFKPWGAGAMPVFGRPTGNELFPLLLEKAAAKFAHMKLGDWVKGPSWLSLKGGWMVVGWAMLTGVTDSSLVDRDSDDGTWKIRKITTLTGSNMKWSNEGSLSGDELFSTMAEWDQLGVMMGCRMSGGSEVNQGEGIFTGHAYSITAVRECSAGRVIQCRNPWGNSREWTGAMSDSSGYWDTDDGRTVADELKYAPKDDGLFWMSWDDWVTHFNRVYVTQTRAEKRNFAVEFTDAFFKMVDRRKNGTFEGPTEKEERALKYLWDSYAGPLGGYIDEQQLLVLLKMLSMPPADEEDDLVATYNQFDSDEDGQVGWSDFFNEMMIRVKDENLN